MKQDTRRFLCATASAIIERFNNGQCEVLLQTRWKPDEDPKHSGLLEIPGGRIEVGEDVLTALKREVREECGLEIESIKPEKLTTADGKSGEVSLAFVPFCCESFLGSNYVGFVFVCAAEGKLATKGVEDGMEPRWIRLSELKHLVDNEPERFFSYHLSALKYYVEQKGKGLI